MIEKIKSISELENIVNGFQDGFVFRGQVNHYLKKNGEISLQTSISRLGCNPPYMQRWVHYCRELLFALFVPDFKYDVSYKIWSALLQHYGWRSSFIDATHNPKIAGWFASHQYKDKKILPIVEDCHELGLIAARKKAWYEKSIKSNGWIYIFSEEKALENQVEIFDLMEFGFSDFVQRYHRQEGLLL